MRIGLALLALLLVLPVPGLAQESRTFGITAKTFVALSIWDFIPEASSETFVITNNPAIGETLSGNSGEANFRAPLHLPDGALLTEIEAVFCDTSATHGFDTNLVIQPRMSPAAGAGGPNSTGPETPGCVDRTFSFGGGIVINNNANTYHILMQLGSDTTIQFSSMRVGYKLQVSPAPATATFNDVPTSHPFFQFIEALAAAGITGGCSTTPPLYCPDAQVTRGQMAAFISRALGLQFAP